MSFEEEFIKATFQTLIGDGTIEVKNKSSRKWNKAYRGFVVFALFYIGLITTIRTIGEETGRGEVKRTSERSAENEIGLYNLRVGYINFVEKQQKIDALQDEAIKRFSN